MNYLVYVDGGEATAHEALVERLSRYNQRTAGVYVVEVRESKAGDKCRVVFSYKDDFLVRLPAPQPKINLSKVGVFL